eukprot:PhF_6_TR19780/c0_g1_i1/m.28846
MCHYYSLLVICVVILLTFTISSSHATSPAECRALGFLPEALKCSTCESLLKSTNDASLDAECRGCCNEDEAGSVKYVRGEFHLAQRLYARAVGYTTLVDVQFKEFSSNLKVVMEDYGAPRLYMYREAGGEAEVFSVSDWSTDTIIDFLRKKLSKSK